MHKYSYTYQDINVVATYVNIICIYVHTYVIAVSSRFEVVLSSLGSNDDSVSVISTSPDITSFKILILSEVDSFNSANSLPC